VAGRSTGTGVLGSSGSEAALTGAGARSIGPVVATVVGTSTGTGALVVIIIVFSVIFMVPTKKHPKVLFWLLLKSLAVIS
jgi:hypothetical protein